MVEIQKLVASEAAVGSLFGSAMATDGEIMAIGADNHGGKGILVVHQICVDISLILFFMFVTRQGPHLCM